MKPNHVICNHCAHWAAKDLYFQACSQCDNTKEVLDPRTRLCNLCGECLCPIGTHNEQYPNGLVDTIVIGGYDSDHLLDMHKYTFSFCEECLRKLFMVAKIPPQIEDAQGMHEITFEDDQRTYEYQQWDRLGGSHQAYLNKKCNAIKECPNKALYTVMLSEEFTEHCCCEEHKKNWDLTINADLVKFIPNVLKAFL